MPPSRSPVHPAPLPAADAPAPPSAVPPSAHRGPLSAAPPSPAAGAPSAHPAPPAAPLPLLSRSVLRPLTAVLALTLVCLAALAGRPAYAGPPPVERPVHTGPPLAGRSASGGPPDGTTPRRSPVPSLTRAAHPLLSSEPDTEAPDLVPLSRATGGARIVGVGEATHSSHQFFAFKHRLFRHLVRTEGFTTFALEANWSAGLRLDDYVVHGRGDPRRIMREEFQNAFRLWNTQEYLDLLTWMRAYNLRHDRRLRFMGNDAAFAGPALFDAVTAHVRDRCPALLPELRRLHAGLRPEGSVDEVMDRYPALPLAQRRDMSRRARAAYDLLRARCPGRDRGRYDLVLQHARVIAQTAKLYAYDYRDQGQVGAAMRHRDRAMADNTVWWRERTGGRVLLSAHNDHVAYETNDPENMPKTQGAFLRDRLGDGYTAVRTSFHRGSFNAMDENERVRKVTVGPAPAGTNEAVLDRVPYRDYAVDLRTVRGPARTWLRGTRLSREAGTAWPDPMRPVALSRFSDVLVHLHRIDEALVLPE